MLDGKCVPRIHERVVKHHVAQGVALKRIATKFEVALIDVCLKVKVKVHKAIQAFGRAGRPYPFFPLPWFSTYVLLHNQPNS